MKNISNYITNIGSIIERGIRIHFSRYRLIRMILYKSLYRHFSKEFPNFLLKRFNYLITWKRETYDKKNNFFRKEDLKMLKYLLHNLSKTESNKDFTSNIQGPQWSKIRTHINWAYSNRFTIEERWCTQRLIWQTIFKMLKRETNEFWKVQNNDQLSL